MPDAAAMPNIKVRRFDPPLEGGWAGYLEPEDASWIAWIGADRVPRFYLHRDAETGAVLPDEPTKRAAALDEIRGEQARRAAWVAPVEGVYYPVFAGETFCGRPQPPALGRDRRQGEPPCVVNVDGILAGATGELAAKSAR